jgi:5-methyltetrahydrofolate--homocysteine methyltransferase
MAAKLMNDKEQVEHELDKKYDTLREEYQHEQEQIVSLEEARKNKPKYEEQTDFDGHRNADGNDSYGSET